MPREHKDLMVDTPLGDRLTRLQMRFCENYLINNFNATKAYIEAGGNPKCADSNSSHLLKMPKVKRYLEMQIKMGNEIIGFTFEDKLLKLKSVTDRCIPDNPLMPATVEGMRCGISAISELNKMQGHHAAEKQVTMNVHVDVDLEKMQELIDKHDREF